MSILEQISAWAMAGWNQTDCAQALGISRYKLQLLLLQHPEFKWPKARSIAHKARAKSWKPIGNPQNVHHLNRGRKAALPRYTVKGVTGTRRELIERFAVVLTHTVDVRIARGWSLEAALFTPRRIKPADTHPWREPIEEAL